MDRVEGAVIAEAEKEAQRIIEEARAESDQRLAKAKEDGEKALDAELETAKLAAERETARQLGRARHEGRLEVLKAKNEVLDRVFGKVRSRLSQLDDGAYLQLVGSWLEGLPADVGGALHANPKDKRRFAKAFVDAVNAKRPQAGRFTSVVADESVSDGCVVQGADFSVDLTLEHRVKGLRNSMSGQLLREIFDK